MKKSVYIISIFLALFVFSLIFPNLFYSPGEIHNKHAGITDCLTCHTPFTKPKVAPCVASSCHDQARWNEKKALYTGHMKTQICVNCHTDHVGADGDLTLIEAHENIEGKTCESCHQLTKLHSKVGDQECADCHIAKAWRPAKMDHSTVKAGAQCSKCHKAPTKHAQTRGECSACHSNKSWKPASVDHLTLAKATPCIDCHKLPIKHFATSNGCADCHFSNKWKPANFKHTFPMQHENRRRDNTCKTCHPISLKEYDCYSGCHEHSVIGVRAEHQEEGIFRISECMKCHPTGREHEGKGRRHQDGKRDDKYDD